ncbi:hypothetical protein JRI60_03840 [Archangium violaceum]|uniref:hypothetical protein n=1 Tax=Archangium violaceum TaxID=83451 RepID=UPI001952291B|nr:hypothetical protein [Archangium violaceum]QRN98211.1 hypothetical protein JRI60_03840 [Archangium violaceum]
MAVRTDTVGIKNLRQADVHAAQSGQQTSKGRPLPFHDELPALRRERLLARARLGPAAEPHLPKIPRTVAPVRGRKKPPSQMHIKRNGG